MSTSRREIAKPGHRRKFLVVSDPSPESECALRFAARRAERTDGQIVMLRVIQPGEFQHWLGVEQIRREEAMKEALALLRLHSRKLKAFSQVEPEHVIREGKTADEIIKLIDADHDIGVLVLGAATGKDGPGPLVTLLASKSTDGYPIPVTIVPGNLTDEEIDELS